MESDEAFPITILVEGDYSEDQPIVIGSLDKYWITHLELGACLFKADDEMRSTAWTERIAYELARAIGLPNVRYELAVDWNGRRGVITPTYLNEGETEILGVDLISSTYGDDDYRYSLEELVNSIQTNQVQLPTEWESPSQIVDTVALMTGYLLFDAWISNIDRHDSNWSFKLSIDGKLELLPNFDSGLSLGVNILPNEIARIDFKKNRGAIVAQPTIHQIKNNKVTSLSYSDLTETLLDRYPVATKYWSERIVSITSTEITQLFERIPEGWIGEPAKNFAIELLEFNRQQIVSICELAVPELSKTDPSYLDDSPAAPVESEVKAGSNQEVGSMPVIDYGNDLMILDPNWQEDTDPIEECYELD